MKYSKILLTGASGLLGSAIFSRLSSDYPVTPLSRHGSYGTRPLNLMDPHALATLKTENWNAIIHCAAFRSPDFCMENREQADILNTEVPMLLAGMCADRQAKFIHISTDYVFDGAKPPYKESDPCNPVNYYGETKLAAEQNIMKEFPGAIILRIPALYGNPPLGIKSTLIEEVASALLSDGLSKQDNIIVRHPTFTGDIAEVISFLLESHFHGIVHASGGEHATRYELAISIGKKLGLPVNHIVESTTDPQRKDRRPVNCRLATDLLAGMNGPIPSGYTVYMPELVMKNIKTRRGQ